MFKRILVPVDRSGFAEKVLPYLSRFSDPAKTQIVLLGVLETLRHAATSFEYAPLLVNEMGADYEMYLKTVQQQFQYAGYKVFSRLVEGDAAEQILEIAQPTSADLIAMATHGRSGVARLALGSVAERVIQNTTLPVLLVHGQTDRSHNKIERMLVPLDGSAMAEKALTHAQRLAKDLGATLLLFRAIAPSDIDPGFAPLPSQAQLTDAYEQAFTQAEAYLDHVALRVRTEGVACQTTVLRGEPAQLICDVANESKIDVVVICTHGRSGLERWVYGSVANQVIRGVVACPVLVVRGTQPAEVKELVKASLREPLAA